MVCIKSNLQISFAGHFLYPDAWMVVRTCLHVIPGLHHARIFTAKVWWPKNKGLPFGAYVAPLRLHQDLGETKCPDHQLQMHYLYAVHYT